VRIGLVGYGAGGRWFHAPYIDAADGVELVGVVTRSPERIAELHAERPGMPTYGSLTELLAAGVDAVTVTTPPQTRRELVLEAIAAGVHVVADKPFATSAESAAELGAAADAAGVRLSVFHQRRADADIVTLKHVLDAGELGPVWRFHSSFDLDEPGSLDAGPHGGLLRDLGSHLVDQALWLFGPAVRVSAEVDWVDLPAGRTDGGFVVTVEHVAGPVSFLSASKLNRLVQRSLAVYAEGGSYVATGSDVQTGAIKAGRRPKDDPDRWGYEPDEHWGRLRTAMGTRVVPSAQGNHASYYTAFAKAVATGGPVPVPVSDAVEVLRVLDAARTSALEHRVVDLSR
jgi:predicted dehydrogenase